MYLFEQLLPGAATAGAVAVGLSMFALRAKDARTARVLTALALGAGYFAGHVFITGWTPFPPTDTTNWLPYFALAAAAVSSLTALFTSKAARIAVLGLVCVGAMRLLLSPKFRYGWSAEQGWLWVGCLGGVVLLLALAIAAVGRRSSIAIELPLLLIFVSSGTAGALIMSGSLLLGQFAAVLSAALLGISLVLIWRRPAQADSAAPVFSLLLVALTTSGYFFAELPLLSAVLLAAAPVGALIPFGVSAPRWAAAVRVVVVAAAVSGAMLAAFLSSPRWSD